MFKQVWQIAFVDIVPALINFLVISDSLAQYNLVKIFVSVQGEKSLCCFMETRTFDKLSIRRSHRNEMYLDLKTTCKANGASQSVFCLATL